jgi:monofunctional glycosyltransferase
MLRNLLWRLFCAILFLAALSVLLVLSMRWIEPIGSGVMIERKVESWISGQPIELQRSWRPWEELPDHLKMAVIAAEDQKFAEHHGFDFAAIRAAIVDNQKGRSVRGASTLSQQVAKNIFLWSGRSWLRKGLEAWFTTLIELLWPKQRILEIYLNSAEWGHGIFGAEAAARAHFGIGAPYLSMEQASLLAAVLPNPRAMNPAQPNAYVKQRANWIRKQIHQLGGSNYLRQI